MPDSQAAGTGQPAEVKGVKQVHWRSMSDRGVNQALTFRIAARWLVTE
jgi:hypothetical protein